ncbi:MAG: hypothetical protein OXN27_04230 [Candidatus Poribacteria bacterium]|nr:hypothetical protein [Candidatus Poribacteria bacterium]
MRLLTLKTIAILTIMAIGFTIVGPFVEGTAEAHCRFYPANECKQHTDWCEERLQWADFNCPGANDAGAQRCIELMEEAARVCAIAMFICYHAESE